MMAIVSALNRSFVQRMRQTWKVNRGALEVIKRRITEGVEINRV